jgi:hypothetical protein
MSNFPTNDIFNIAQVVQEQRRRLMDAGVCGYTMIEARAVGMLTPSHDIILKWMITNSGKSEQTSITLEGRYLDKLVDELIRQRQVAECNEPLLLSSTRFDAMAIEVEE